MSNRKFAHTETQTQTQTQTDGAGNRAGGGTNVVLVVDLDHGCVGTGTKALDLQQSEHAVL